MARTFPFTRGVVATVGLLYAAGFAVVLATVGPWEAVRGFAVEGVILAVWLWIAHRLLKEEPFLPIAVKRPGLELALGVLTMLLLATGVTGYYAGVRGMRLLALAALIPVAVLVGLRYDRRAAGLAWASRRAWLTVLAVIAVNWLVGPVAGSLLPSGELPTPPGADLSEQFSSPLTVLLLLVQLAAVAAIPEELAFRVYLAPRLACFLPVGWAILVQALLFSGLHVPQQVLRYGYPPGYVLAAVLSINNGLIGGYFWWRTRSLPLLVVLHLFAYPRIGL